MSTPQSSSRELDGSAQSRHEEARRPSDDPTDYEHRHFVNLLSIVFLLVMAAGIVWAFKAMEDNEALQRCIASGRRDCVKIDAAPSNAIRLPVR